MAWEIVVGIETHAQLLTRSKMFSGASTAFGAPPNSQASAVDIALPGVLPVANAAAVEMAVKFGLAVGGRINARSVFARKNYFYPDLPKGYQISQYEIPIVAGGQLKISLPGGEKTVRLTRAHLEEDAGKSIHNLYVKDGYVEDDYVGEGLTGIDLNRAGVPLLEIVSEPEIRGAREAVAYARTLHTLVVWIGICDGNMQEGSFRCDANVSVRKVGESKLGTRCELKNLNSFRFMEQAIEYEARRQIELLEDGGTVLQETRLFDPDQGETRAMRTKEEAHDYRYFPDPDLLPLVVTEEEIERIRKELPELPNARRERFVTDLKLSAYDANVLVESREKADYFERSAGAGLAIIGISPKLTANLVIGEVSARLNSENRDFSDVPVPPERLAKLATRVSDGTISQKIAKDVLVDMWTSGADPDDIIARRGLQQISDAGVLEKIVADVLSKNARQAEDYRAGKEKAFNSLVGQVMKATQGKANPAQVNRILKAKLAG